MEDPQVQRVILDLPKIGRPVTRCTNFEFDNNDGSASQQDNIEPALQSQHWIFK